MKHSLKMSILSTILAATLQSPQIKTMEGSVLYDLQIEELGQILMEEAFADPDFKEQIVDSLTRAIDSDHLFDPGDVVDGKVVGKVKKRLLEFIINKTGEYYTDITKKLEAIRSRADFDIVTIQDTSGTIMGIDLQPTNPRLCIEGAARSSIHIELYCKTTRFNQETIELLRPVADIKGLLDEMDLIYDSDFRFYPSRLVLIGPDQLSYKIEFKNSTKSTIKAAIQLLKHSLPENMDEFDQYFRYGYTIHQIVDDLKKLGLALWNYGSSEFWANRLQEANHRSLYESASDSSP